MNLPPICSTEWCWIFFICVILGFVFLWLANLVNDVWGYTRIPPTSATALALTGSILFGCGTGGFMMIAIFVILGSIQ